VAFASPVDFPRDGVLVMQRSSQLMRVWFCGCDLLLTGLAWLAAYYLRFQSGWLPTTKDPSDFALCWHNLPLLLALALAAYQMTGQYAIDRLRRLREEALSVLKGTGLLALLVLATTFYRRDPYESRLTLTLFFVLTPAAVLVQRRLTWGLIRALRQAGYNQSFALLVGSGRVARKAARALRRASWMGIKSVGFVDDNPGPLTSDLDLLGGVADLPALVSRYNISHVFIALPMTRYAEARRIFDVLSQELVDVRLVADLPNLAGVALTTSNLDGLPLVGLRESPHFGLNIVVKRAMDVVLSALGLLFLAPLLLVIALLVKLTSRGPVFYVQERCGLNGRAFRMLKFRSMRTDAEASGAGWTQANDPRRTRFGTFLRRTSLDELPQLWNILKGDMTLVGPRPERPEYIGKFSRTLPNYMTRHRVKPGLTGWAQVHGWRGNTSLRKRLQYDLHYITHWTPWLDLRILWLTLFKGIIHRNAY
jgi:Undecaprenyl-phosphate glucose phosphotransferase